MLAATALCLDERRGKNESVSRRYSLTCMQIKHVKHKYYTLALAFAEEQSGLNTLKTRTPK